MSAFVTEFATHHGLTLDDDASYVVWALAG